MVKSKKVGRPSGRNPVIAVRLAPPLHREIVEDAKASERTLSAEMEHLLRAALDTRKRFPSAFTRAMEAVTFAAFIAGDAYARDISKSADWQADPEARRAAAVAGCKALLMFASADPQQQLLTCSVLRGEVAFPLANPRPRQEDAP